MDHLYLDYAATTPVRAEVRAAMAPYFSERFGNPSSVHRWGREAAEALETAREELAGALEASPAEVVFVRGGTESDNMAILGWSYAQRARGETPTVAISAVEHHAVLEAAEHLAAAGLARVVKIGVTPFGDLDLDALSSVLDAGPALLSVMWVNNESGMVLPVGEVAHVVRERGGLLHSDAAQAIGKVAVDLSKVHVDLLSGTGHKIYGPKGTGFLLIREGIPLAPLLHGGGQEGALRPGTQDVAGAVGLATAVRLAVEEREATAERLAGLRERLEHGLHRRLDDIRMNGGEAARAPHVLSVAIGGVEDGAALVMALDLEGVAVSGGSACTSGSAASSHVMQALYGADDPYATVRFSFGRDSNEADIDRAIRATVTVVTRARET